MLTWKDYITSFLWAVIATWCCVMAAMAITASVVFTVLFIGWMFS